MNTNSVLSPHPNYEQLFNYANKRTTSDKSLINHLDNCPECREELDIINEMCSLLSSETTNVPQHFSSHHLTDATINEYVYNRLSKDNHSLVQKHLQECTACLTEVLSFRAVLEDRNRQESSEIIQFKQKTSTKKRNQLAGLTIAASVILISFIYLLPSISNKTTIKENNIPLDIIAQHPNSNDSILPILPVTMNGPGRVMVSNGLINWYGEYVEAEAVGTVDMKKMNNTIQAEILAEKAARANAYAQISEILGGVQVSQNSTYKDMLIQVDYLNIENEAFIRNAKVVKKDIKWINDSPKVTVIMRVPLFGNDGLQSIILPHLAKKNSEQQKNSQKSFQETLTKPYAQYTGVIVDTRKTNYQPAMNVNFEVANLSNKEDYKLIKDIKFKHYPEFEVAKQRSKSGENPFIIKAKEFSDKGVIKLTSDEMNATNNILSHNQTQESIAVLY